MAAPVTPGRVGRAASQDSVDDAGASRGAGPGPGARGDSPTHDELLRSLRILTDYSLHLTSNLSNQYVSIDVVKLGKYPAGQAPSVPAGSAGSPPDKVHSALDGRSLADNGPWAPATSIAQRKWGCMGKS